MKILEKDYSAGRPDGLATKLVGCEHESHENKEESDKCYWRTHPIEREKYLNRQGYADVWFNTPSIKQSREYFLNLIDEAKQEGASEYQERIKQLVKESDSWEEFKNKLQYK